VSLPSSPSNAHARSKSASMNTYRFALVTFAMAVLAGCGQKGPLTLPDETTEQPLETESSTGDDEAADDESQNDG